MWAASICLTLIWMCGECWIVIACPENCDCNADTMTCTRPDMPPELPANITKLFIKEFDFDNWMPETLNKTRWEKLMFLDIHGMTGYMLQGRSFSGFQNLMHLGLHGDYLVNISSTTFFGIDKVRSLDLSNNFHLSLDIVLSALNPHVLPALANLTIARLFSLRAESMDLDYTFMKSVTSGRSLKYLDISFTSINILDFSHISLLCDSLEHMKAHNITLLYPKDFHHAPACKSVRTLDITDTFFPIALRMLTFFNAGFNCPSVVAFSNIENLIVSGTLKIATTIESYHLDISNCIFHLKKIVLRRNNLKWINVTVTLSETLQNSLVELDLSENIIEYLSPETLYPSKNTQVLSLSSNRMHKMQTDHGENFERLLQGSIKLREFYFSNNKLTDIPRLFFTSNRQLQLIDLSRNMLRSVRFKMQHLQSLRYLDLSNNLITILDEGMLMQFDNLNMQQNKRFNADKHMTHQSESPVNHLGESGGFHVNLGSNPFECSCISESVHFIKWLRYSASVYRQNMTYVCDFHGESLDILTSAIPKIKRYCDHQQILNVVKMGVPIVVIFLILCCVSLIMVRRRISQKKNYQTILSQLQCNEYPKKFLVFLSYCSEDADFVHTHIFDQLNNALSKLTNNSKTFVCIGDRDFLLGRTVHSEVIRCLEDSAVVIFVVSKKFCVKEWCLMEVNEASDQRKPIIMLMKEHVNVSDMPYFLGKIFKRYTHAAWVNDENGGHLEPNMNGMATSVIELASSEVKF